MYNMYKIKNEVKKQRSHTSVFFLSFHKCMFVLWVFFPLLSATSFLFLSIKVHMFIMFKYLFLFRRPNWTNYYFLF